MTRAQWRFEACETDPDTGAVVRVLGVGQTEEEARQDAALEIDALDRQHVVDGLHVRSVPYPTVRGAL